MFSFSNNLPKYKQSMRSIDSIWRYIWSYSSYNSRKRTFTGMGFIQEDQCFKQKLMTKCFKTLKKSHFEGIFDYFQLFLPKADFSLKIRTQFHRDT